MPGIKKTIAVITVSTVVLVIACGDKQNRSPDEDFAKLIPSFVTDSFRLDPSNPFTKEKAELGRYLFYDRRLSVNNTKACASCHDPVFSFTDSYNRSIGALGDLHRRNALPLINIVFNKYLTAADSGLHFPEQQMNNPMLNQHPVELGIKGNEKQILEKLKREKIYADLFSHAFPGEDDPFTIRNVQQGIASFVKTILSFNAPYDQYRYLNKKNVLTESQQRGLQLFLSDSLACGKCHGGINLSTPVLTNNDGTTQYYFNTGLFNTDEKGSYPVYDPGLIEITKAPRDMGKYRVPALRNLAFTAPYFHDGSVLTLEAVITIYENGGRVISNGINAGDGRKNPYKNPLIKGFRLNSQQRSDLVNFLLSCSDSALLKNPAYANPFQRDETN